MNNKFVIVENRITNHEFLSLSKMPFVIESSQGGMGMAFSEAQRHLDSKLSDMASRNIKSISDSLSIMLVIMFLMTIVSPFLFMASPKRTIYSFKTSHEIINAHWSDIKNMKSLKNRISHNQ